MELLGHDLRNVPALLHPIKWTIFLIGEGAFLLDKKANKMVMFSIRLGAEVPLGLRSLKT
jgi:hypothetical protein